MKTLLASIPDQILGHILSFLSMKESYKKALSRNSGVILSVSSLDLDEKDFTNYNDFYNA
ncbi:hypothetical protein A2U01_0115193, partial [Trifolium medium]|nr:hypothetical protein [Trifolium medium]